MVNFQLDPTFRLKIIFIWYKIVYLRETAQN